MKTPSSNTLIGAAATLLGAALVFGCGGGGGGGTTSSGTDGSSTETGGSSTTTTGGSSTTTTGGSTGTACSAFPETNLTSASGQLTSSDGNYVFTTSDVATLTASTNLVFRFASSYSADAYVIPQSSVADFKAGRNFQSYDAFKSQVGFHPLKLDAGSYAIAIRSKEKAANGVSAELDLNQAAAATSSYSGVQAQGSSVVAAGGRYATPLTLASGYRYTADGGNSGMRFYLIPASELTNFKTSGATFHYYPDYSSDFDDPQQPGRYEIKGLSAGTYYLCWYNDTAETQSLDYDVERWKDSCSRVEPRALASSTDPAHSSAQRATAKPGRME